MLEHIDQRVLDRTSALAAMITRKEACRMFGVALRTWVTWVNEGRVPRGTFSPLPSGKAGRCRVYALEDLKPLLEEFRRLTEPYPDPTRPGCYRVRLASHIHQMEAIIDTESLSVVQDRRWNWDPRSDGKNGGVILAGEGISNIPLRRFIAGVAEADEDSNVNVSHRNGDPLDCRRANLIVRTIQEQIYSNRKRRTNQGRPCTSKYKGVSWSEERGKWVAQIRKEGQHKNIGRFNDEIAAAEAYDQAARELFGEHARLNFPHGIDAPLMRDAA